MDRTETFFELESSIVHWKLGLQGHGAMSVSQAAELETHLRDSIASLQADGLSEEEAFLIAKYRLGSAPSLQTEYRKVHSQQLWLHRTLLMIGGYLFISLFLEFVALDQAFVRWLGSILGWGSADIPLPFFGNDYRVPWTGIAHFAVGLLNVGILGWVLWSLAQGEWFVNRRLPSPGVCITVWGLASLGVVGARWFLTTLAVRATPVVEAGHHSASAGLANIGIAATTAVLLVSLLALLWKKSQPSIS